MRKVVVTRSVWSAETNRYERVEQPELAAFHGFSLDHEEYEKGPGHHPVAIVEWPDGKVEVVYAGLIQFVTDQPGQPLQS